MLGRASSVAVDVTLNAVRLPRVPGVVVEVIPRVLRRCMHQCHKDVRVCDTSCSRVSTAATVARSSTVQPACPLLCHGCQELAEAAEGLTDRGCTVDGLTTSDCFDGRLGKARSRVDARGDAAASDLPAVLLQGGPVLYTQCQSVTHLAVVSTTDECSPVETPTKCVRGVRVCLFGPAAEWPAGGGAPAYT